MFAGPGLVVVISAGAGLLVAGVCWRKKVVAGSGLVVSGVCWCRKVVAGSGLVVAGEELVVAAAVKWLPLQEGSCWCRLKEY